jgi:hypothetical protein
MVQKVNLELVYGKVKTSNLKKKAEKMVLLLPFLLEMGCEREGWRRRRRRSPELEPMG